MSYHPKDSDCVGELEVENIYFCFLDSALKNCPPHYPFAYNNGLGCCSSDYCEKDEKRLEFSDTCCDLQHQYKSSCAGETCMFQDFNSGTMTNFLSRSTLFVEGVGLNSSCFATPRDPHYHSRIITPKDTFHVVVCRTFPDILNHVLTWIQEKAKKYSSKFFLNISPLFHRIVRNDQLCMDWKQISFGNDTLVEKM